MNEWILIDLYVIYQVYGWHGGMSAEAVDLEDSPKNNAYILVALL